VAAGAWVAAGAPPQAEVKSNRNTIPAIRALRLVNIFFSFRSFVRMHDQMNTRPACLLFTQTHLRSWALLSEDNCPTYS